MHVDVEIALKTKAKPRTIKNWTTKTVETNEILISTLHPLMLFQYKKFQEPLHRSEKLHVWELYLMGKPDN